MNIPWDFLNLSTSIVGVGIFLIPGALRYFRPAPKIKQNGEPDRGNEYLLMMGIGAWWAVMALIYLIRVAGGTTAFVYCSQPLADLGSMVMLWLAFNARRKPPQPVLKEGEIRVEGEPLPLLFESAWTCFWCLVALIGVWSVRVAVLLNFTQDELARPEMRRLLEALLAPSLIFAGASFFAFSVTLWSRPVRERASRRWDRICACMLIGYACLQPPAYAGLLVEKSDHMVPVLAIGKLLVLMTAFLAFQGPLLSRQFKGFFGTDPQKVWTELLKLSAAIAGLARVLFAFWRPPGD